MTGLQWSDVFAKGNAAGFAIGAPGNAASLAADRKAIMWEAFYRYKVSDAISITPAVFYVSNNQGLKNASDNYGGVIQTKFTF
jgi:carbohydrate-selective porin OprB